MKTIKSWRHALLESDATLQAAIRNLDQSGLQIILIISKKDFLVGTITDGDIRRGLLRGMKMNSAITSIVNREPIVVSPDISELAAFEMMRTKGVNQVPIVNESGCVIGLHVLRRHNTCTSRENIFVLMVGGEGRRLRPLTDHCPKPMLLVGGKPILEHIILRAKAEGFQKFILSVNYLSNVIEDYFGYGERLGVEIDYIREDSPLGTAGALRLLTPRPDISFIVANGDVLTDIRYGDFMDFHALHDATATMAVRSYDWRHPFGVVETDGVNITGFEEKPLMQSYINSGVYVLKPEALKVLGSNERCDMPELFNRLRGEGSRTVVYLVREPWIDVGRVDDLNRARSLYSKNQ